MIVQNSSSSSSGIGLFGLLGVVFITLKLMGYIDWSWWLVTLPLWGPITLILCVVAITAGLLFVLDKK